jgi:glyceraldehyde-3-phosphate dehydrogenase/erythrose-4-phosphate dehydrogenase
MPKQTRKFGMTIKAAINGLGRIGRATLKLVMDEPSIELVAVNDLVDVERREGH